MPAHRIKSCESCRIAKARCSLSAPCTRCATRKIECIYAPSLLHSHGRRKNNDLRILRPAKRGPLLDGITCATSPTADATTTPGVGVGAGVDPVVTRDTLAASLTAKVHIAGHQDSLTAQLGNTHQHEEWSLLFDLPATDNLQSFDAFLDPPFNSWLSDLDLLNARHGLTGQVSADVQHMMNNLDIPRAPTAFIASSLTPRTRSLQQGSLTAKMVCSRITAYTRILADGHVPPFIHPPCALGSSDECPPASCHQCFPETLAVCVNLTKMFHSRTRASHSFVWQQICTHIRQMRAEVKYSSTIVLFLLC